MLCVIDGTDQDFLDPIGKFQNLRRLTGRSTAFWPARSTAFLRKVFVHSLMDLMKNFQKEGRDIGEVLKFVTQDGVSENKR